MESPLSSEQQALESKKIEDMSVAELKLWIDACDRIEQSNIHEIKVGRNWTSAKAKAERELQKRLSNKKKIIADLLEEEGIDYQQLDTEELEELEQAWKDRFNAQKLINANSQLWHTFSFDGYSNYKEGEEADQKYKNQLVKEYYIWGGDKGYLCFSNKLPDLAKLKRLTRGYETTYDLYVNHKNFNWTYVYTHEDYYGPYFAV